MLMDKMKFQITRFKYTYADLSTASTSLTIDIPIWGKDYVFGLYGRIKTAFSGTSVSTITMKIGVSGSTDCIMRERNLAVTGNLTTHLETTPKRVMCFEGIEPEVRYSDNVPQLTFTSTGANLSALTAGEFELILARIVVDQ